MYLYLEKLWKFVGNGRDLGEGFGGFKVGLGWASWPVPFQNLAPGPGGSFKNWHRP